MLDRWAAHFAPPAYRGMWIRRISLRRSGRLAARQRLCGWHVKLRDSPLILSFSTCRRDVQATVQLRNYARSVQRRSLSPRRLPGGQNEGRVALYGSQGSAASCRASPRTTDTILYAFEPVSCCCLASFGLRATNRPENRFLGRHSVTISWSICTQWLRGTGGNTNA